MPNKIIKFNNKIANSNGKMFKYKVPEPLYLCFTAEQANSTVQMKQGGRSSPSYGQAFQYSTDAINWNNVVVNTTVITLANVGDKVYFKGDNIRVSEGGAFYYFVMTGVLSGSGTVMSLLDSTCKSTNLAGKSYCFQLLFADCSSLITAPALTATTLSSDCYYKMFTKCTSLTTPPALPATTLDNAAYKFMFDGCTSLQVSDTQTSAAPHIWTIPASGTFTYTADDGGYGIFYNCAGTRSSNTMPGVSGQSYTYYTQNEPTYLDIHSQPITHIVKHIFDNTITTPKTATSRISWTEGTDELLSTPPQEDILIGLGDVGSFNISKGASYMYWHISGSSTSQPMYFNGDAATHYQFVYDDITNISYIVLYHTNEMIGYVIKAGNAFI